MGNHIGHREEWIAVSERILHARPEELQQLLLDISKQHPEMSFYATDLARLRMAGRKKAKELEQLWRDRSAERINAMARSRPGTTDPGSRALAFLATLVGL